MRISQRGQLPTPYLDPHRDHPTATNHTRCAPSKGEEPRFCDEGWRLAHAHTGLEYQDPGADYYTRAGPRRTNKALKQLEQPD